MKDGVILAAALVTSVCGVCVLLYATSIYEPIFVGMGEACAHAGESVRTQGMLLGWREYSSGVLYNFSGVNVFSREKRVAGLGDVANISGSVVEKDKECEIYAKGIEVVGKNISEAKIFELPERVGEIVRVCGEVAKYRNVSGGAILELYDETGGVTVPVFFEANISSKACFTGIVTDYNGMAEVVPKEY